MRYRNSALNAQGSRTFIVAVDIAALILVEGVQGKKTSSSSFIGLMRVVVLKGGEIGEEVRSVGKVTTETKGIPSSSVNREFFLFP